MLIRTHLAIGLAIGLYFMELVNNPLIFLAAVIVSTFLPNLGSIRLERKIGRLFGVKNKEVVKRGLLHSYTFCIIISIILAFFWPILALPFFIGYSFHLFADSFTPEGIAPFWPYKQISKGVIRRDGKVEKTMFGLFLMIDLVLVIVSIAKLVG